MTTTAHTTTLSAEELIDAVVAAKGVTRGFRTSKPHAWQAADGRWFVRFTTTHTYGRSNGIAALNDVGTFVRSHTPQGAKTWACEPAEGMDTAEARRALVPGATLVLPDGSTGTVTDVDYFTKFDTDSCRFNMDHTEHVVSALADGRASIVD